MARRELRGLSVVKGLALGAARLSYPLDFATGDGPIAKDRIAAEVERMSRAIAGARSELLRVRQGLRGPHKRELAEFVDAHALIVDDPEFSAGVRRRIENQRQSAESALKSHRDELVKAFEALDDPYLRSRGEDVEQVIARVFAALKRGDGDAAPRRAPATGVVVIAESLAPDELDWWHQHGLVGLVLTRASRFSHTTILAKSFRTPLVIAEPDVFERVRDGDMVLLDAEVGLAIVDPDALDLARLREKRRAGERSRRALSRLKGSATETRDGVEIALHANAEQAADIALARRLGAAGIGLYRTEFLYLGRARPADEDEQFRGYRDAVLQMAGRPVTLRTLDLGADKGGAALAIGDEDNPALGLRGVRLLLAHRELFKQQLRAMLRASAWGPIRILVPMVASVGEAHAVRALIDESRGDLEHAGVAYAERVPLGAMIEVPAAALIADDLAAAVDFFSIGSNDLVQYTLAADRNNARVSAQYDPCHPAVLRLIAFTVDAARRGARPVSLCGELAADPRYTALLLGLGLTELSVHPAALLEIRERIRAIHLGALRKRARRLMKDGTLAELVGAG